MQAVVIDYDRRMQADQTETLRGRIDLVCSLRGWDRSAWALRAGVARSTLGNIYTGARGKKSPSDTWRKLARAANVSVRWLRDNVGAMEPYKEEETLPAEVDQRWSIRDRIRTYARAYPDLYTEHDLEALNSVLLKPEDAGDAKWWLDQLDSCRAVRMQVEAHAQQMRRAQEKTKQKGKL